ncbi:leucine rich repeat-containing protein, partial [Toxoplasma gondii MAS]
MWQRVLQQPSEEGDLGTFTASSDAVSAPVSPSSASRSSAVGEAARPDSKIVSYRDILSSQKSAEESACEARCDRSPPPRVRCVPAVVASQPSGVRTPGQGSAVELSGNGVSVDSKAEGKAFLMSVPSSGRPSSDRRSEEAPGSCGEKLRTLPAVSGDAKTASLPQPPQDEGVTPHSARLRRRKQFLYTKSWDQVQRMAKKDSGGLTTPAASLSVHFPLRLPGKCVSVFSSSSASSVDSETLEKPTVVVSLQKRKRRHEESEEELDVPAEREQLRLAVPSAASLFAERHRSSPERGCGARTPSAEPRGSPRAADESACVLHISRLSPVESTSSLPTSSLPTSLGFQGGCGAAGREGQPPALRGEGCPCLSPELVWGLPLEGLSVLELRASDCGVSHFAPDFYVHAAAEVDDARRSDRDRAADESESGTTDGEEKRSLFSDSQRRDVAARPLEAPAGGFFSLLPSLQVLDLRSNNIAALPESIDCLVHLETLLLDGNVLTAVPSAVLTLPALKKLSLSSNFLTIFPSAALENRRLDDQKSKTATRPRDALHAPRDSEEANRDAPSRDEKQGGRDERGADKGASPLRKLRVDCNFLGDISFLLCSSPGPSGANASGVFFENLVQVHVDCNVFTLLPLGLHRLPRLRTLSLDWLRYTSPPFPRVVRGSLMRQFLSRLRALEAWLHAQAAALLRKVEAAVEGEAERPSARKQGGGDACESEAAGKHGGRAGESGELGSRMHARSTDAHLGNAALQTGETDSGSGLRPDEDRLLLCGSQPCSRFAQMVENMQAGTAERSSLEEGTRTETELFAVASVASRDRQEAAPLAPWLGTDLASTPASLLLPASISSSSPSSAASSNSPFSSACPCCISFLEFVHFFSTDVAEWVCPETHPSPRLLAKARRLLSAFNGPAGLSSSFPSPSSPCSSSSSSSLSSLVHLFPAAAFSSSLPHGVSALLFSLCVVEVRRSIAQAFAADVVLARDAMRRTRLHVAALDGHEGVARALLRGLPADFNALDADAASPLFLAVKENQFNLVALLAEEAAARLRAVATRLETTEAKARDDKSAKYRAAVHPESLGSTLLLLPYPVPGVSQHHSTSSSLNLPPCSAASPSCPVSGELSVYQRRVLAAYHLLNSGAGTYGTPLHVATVMFDFSLCALLLHAGADPTAVDADGNTALHVLFSVFDKGCPDLDPAVLETLRGSQRRRASPAALSSFSTSSPPRIPSSAPSSSSFLGPTRRRVEAASSRGKERNDEEETSCERKAERPKSVGCSGGEEASSCVRAFSSGGESGSPNPSAPPPSRTRERETKSEYSRARLHFLALLGEPLPAAVEVGLLLLRHPNAEGKDAHSLPLLLPAMSLEDGTTESAANKRNENAWSDAQRAPTYAQASSPSLSSRVVPGSSSSSSSSSSAHLLPSFARFPRSFSALLSSEIRLCIRANQLNNDRWGAMHLAARRGQIFALWFSAELSFLTPPRCLRGTCEHAERADFLAPTSCLLAATRLYTRAAEAGSSCLSSAVQGARKETRAHTSDWKEAERSPLWREGVPSGDMWVDWRRGRDRENETPRQSCGYQAEAAGAKQATTAREKTSERESNGGSECAHGLSNSNTCPYEASS